MFEKKIAVKSTFWAGIEQYATQGIQFISGIVMARLLLPEDYGILAMLFIFMDISAMVTDMGFTTALIRKQNCTDEDYSTVFYVNVVISILLYIIFCISSSIIAKFYSQPILCKVIPVIGFTFILNSLYSVAATKLTKDLKFDIKARITIIESILSISCGIVLAYLGYGIWALVIQILVKAFLRFLFFSIAVKWKPVRFFSTKSLKGLSGFGSKVMGANLLFTLYQNAYSIIIGKFFSPDILGYFSRADGYSKLIPINISTILMKVMMPIISKIQDNDVELVGVNKKVIVVTSFIIFPASMLLAGAASPLISIMLTDKWLSCVPILQILCFAIMIEHIAWINWDFILSKGYSGIVLKNRICTCLFSISALLITIWFGIKWVAFAKVISSVFTVSISIWYLKKILPINICSIVKECCGMFITSLVIGLITYLLFGYLDYNILNLIIVLSIAVCVYLIIARFYFKTPLIILMNIVKDK